MIKKTITFEDFDGNEVIQDHYFHLNKSELIDMELSEKGGLSSKLEEIVAGGDATLIISTFNNIIRSSYGQRDPANPQKFFKSESLSADFMGSLAFDALFTELMTDPQAAAEFVNGLIPKDILANPEVQKALNRIQSSETTPSLPDPNALDGPKQTWPAEPEDRLSGLKNPRGTDGKLLPWAHRVPTTAEQTTMSRAQLLDVMQRQSSGWAG